MLFAADTPTKTAPPSDPRGPRPSPLIAAVAFLDGVARVARREALAAWLAREVVAWGWAEPSPVVFELGHPPVELRGRGDDAALAALLRDTRRRVALGLQRLGGAASDAPLTVALIERGSVRRSSVTRRWEPAVLQTRPLSELVLSLIVADMLERPEVYRDRLAICARCDRISFQPLSTGRDGCVDHPSR